MVKLLKYMKNYTAAAIAAPLLKLFEAILELCVPIVVASIIDKGIGNHDTAYVIRMCLLLVIMAAGGFAFSVVAQFFSAKAACGSASDLRSALFYKIQSLNYSQYDSVGTSTLITRMTGDINQVQTGINLTLRLLLRSPLVVFGAMMFAFIVGSKAPSATVTFAVLIPVLAIIVFIILLSGIPAFGKAQGKLDKVTGDLRSNLEGARVIRAFRLEEHECNEFAERINSHKRFQLAAGRISALLNPITFVAVNIAVIVLLNNGAIEVNSDNLTQGELVALYNYMTQILVELIKFANLIITVTKSIACAKRISAVMDIDTEKNAEAIETSNRNDKTVVSFDKVSFAYPGASGEALKDITLDAQSGEFIGIIGGTGSGKSTLVSLIPKFYEAGAGIVTVNGNDVRKSDADKLRSSIGYTAQHATLFKGTIRDNVRFGKSDASDDEIFEALDAAQLKEFAVSLPYGLDTVIEQGGRNLSGGQKQRLCVARALVRKPEILIFDDSSSALDRLTDANMRRAIRSFDYRPTVFIVSQKVESIKDCDKIAVLDGGRLVGYGCHGELFDNCDVYREICESQKGGEEI